MKRNRHWENQTAELGELELSLLLLVWCKGRLTAEQIGQELGGPVNGAGMRAALHLLEEHGLLAHSIESRALVYRPAGPFNRVTVRALKPLQSHLRAGVAAD
jgi:predicted transcriptional regulator